MEKNQTQILREMLNDIKCNPKIAGLDNDGKRIDYLLHYLDGYLEISEDKITYRFWVGLPHWVEAWILKNKPDAAANVQFSFLWYQMVYSITSTEEEAWELFFRLSYEYLDQLEAETKNVH